MPGHLDRVVGFINLQGLPRVEFDWDLAFQTPQCLAQRGFAHTDVINVALC